MRPNRGTIAEAFSLNNNCVRYLPEDLIITHKDLLEIAHRVYYENEINVLLSEVIKTGTFYCSVATIHGC